MPVAALSTDERRALEVLADPLSVEDVRRVHLEKLSRLDLIEPCPQGVCLSFKGKRVLSGGA